MSDAEKILLLQLILMDIRGDWHYPQSRAERALDLARELNFQHFVSSIEFYLQQCAEGEDDGRYFRCPHTYGGYDGMDELHALSLTFQDKSDEFKDQVKSWLNYPEYVFEDDKDGNLFRQSKERR